MIPNDRPGLDAAVAWLEAPSPGAPARGTREDAVLHAVHAEWHDRRARGAPLCDVVAVARPNPDGGAPLLEFVAREAALREHALPGGRARPKILGNASPDAIVLLVVLGTKVSSWLITDHGRCGRCARAGEAR